MMNSADIELSDSELLGRAFRGIVHENKPYPAWLSVADVVCVGRTTAKALCLRFGLDPGTGEKLQERPADQSREED